MVNINKKKISSSSMTTEDTSIASACTKLTEQEQKDIVLYYLGRVASAAGALTFQNDSSDMDTDRKELDDKYTDVVDCQEYLDHIARDLLAACHLDILAQAPSKHLPKQKLPPVDLERDIPRDYKFSSIHGEDAAQDDDDDDDEEEEEESDEFKYKKWQRVDYVRNLLRAMAPLALDVAARIAALLVPHDNSDYKSTAGDDETEPVKMVPQEDAEAVFLLFAIWLPIAPQITPLVLDLFCVEVFSNPFEAEITKSVSSLKSTTTTWSDHEKEKRQFKMLLLVQAAQSICHFFELRGEIKILIDCWNWSVVFLLLNQTQQIENKLDNDESQDQEMADASHQTVTDGNNSYLDIGYQIQDAIRWNLARIITCILEVTPLARGQYFEKLNVRTVRVPWVVHPWTIDQEEATTQELQMTGKARIWTTGNDEPSFVAPSSEQIRNFIPVHHWLVPVGHGIVFVKHAPISSGLSSHETLNTAGSFGDGQQENLSLNYLSTLTSTNHKKNRRGNLTRTATTADNLALLGAAMCSGTNPRHPPPPVLVCGPHGSGKSSLVRELALIFGGGSSSHDSRSHGQNYHQRHHLLEIHVDEETDAKTLVGSYTTTDIPGEFAWKAGALTQAVRSGKWVLIEDVDSVSMEIQSALTKLLEDRVLPLGVSGKMERCHPNFRLFGTCTTMADCRSSSLMGRGGRIAEKKILNSSVWRKVHVRPLPYDELEEVAMSLYPHLPLSICDSALAMLKAVDQSGRESSEGSTKKDVTNFPHQQQRPSSQLPVLMTGGRNPSVRDFFKLLARISNGIVFENNTEYTTESQRTLCMAESVDIFLAACPDRERRREFIRRTVAPTWGLTADLALGYLETRRPVTLIDTDFVEIGRSKLPLVRNDTMQSGSDGFTETSFSLRLMESIAVGLKQNEPLLLGKTRNLETTVESSFYLVGSHLFLLSLSLDRDQLGKLAQGTVNEEPFERVC